MEVATAADRTGNKSRYYLEICSLADRKADGASKSCCCIEAVSAPEPVEATWEFESDICCGIGIDRRVNIDEVVSS